MKKVRRTARKRKERKRPVIGYWDVETSLLLTGVFQRFLHSAIPFSMVFQDWFMFCAAIQIEGEKAELISILDDPERFDKDFTDDYYVIKRLRDFIDSVDILIAHNGDHFDWKKFKRCLIRHKIKPPRKPILIDTYKESKTAQFTSGKLGDLAIQLDLPHKAHSDRGNWLICTLPYGTYKIGTRKIVVTKETKIRAIKKMGKYNLKDLPPLRALYLRLRPYMTRHPNLNQWAEDGVPVCRNCGSINVRPDGSTRGFKKYICDNCGHTMQGHRRNYTMKLR